MIPNFNIERKLIQKGFKYVAGIDEAGRGSWAGPLIAVAVIFHPNDVLIHYHGKGLFTEINDSKKLDKAKRETLYKKIIKTACSIGIGTANVETIDRVGVGKGNILAMYKALLNLNKLPDFTITDYLKITPTALSLDNFSYKNSKLKRILENQKGIKFGDTLSISIAAASIVAKVYRDKLMEEIHLKYPEYNFKQNKGYPSKEHIEALNTIGPCPIHRKSFFPISQIPLPKLRNSH